MAHKKQVRIGVFETNSSSTHSITICTPEELKQLQEEDFTNLSSDLVREWENMKASELDTYIYNYITPGGEKIVIFGDYGYDG